MPMLETDSVEVLEQWQEICSLIGFCEWDRAKERIEQLRQKVVMSYPRVRQAFLLFDALILQEYKREWEKSLDMLQKALYITMPDIEGDKKWWVFQREEIIIASNIASTYRILGKMEEARRWYQAIRFSLQQQKGKSGLEQRGYAILMESVDNYLGQEERYEEAIEANKEAVSNYLKQPEIDTLDRAYYRIAWNTCKLSSKQKMQHELYRKQWMDAFQASETVADLFYDEYIMEFLQKRRKDYLM